MSFPFLFSGHKPQDDFWIVLHGNTLTCPQPWRVDTKFLASLYYFPFLCIVLLIHQQSPHWSPLRPSKLKDSTERPANLPQQGLLGFHDSTVFSNEIALHLSQTWSRRKFWRNSSLSFLPTKLTNMINSHYLLSSLHTHLAHNCSYEWPPATS